MQSQQDLVKTVSKNLKYYFDVKRREDGFDLSGPYVPRPDHPPLKSRPTLMYDGLHDKAVKHYFTKHEARQRITHMQPPDSFTMDKARSIKRQLRRYMKKYSFTMPWIGTSASDPKGITNSSKYVTDPFQMLRESPHETPKFTKPFRGGRPLLRAAPPHTISRGEAVRLVNAASRSLFAVINGYRGDDQKEPDEGEIDADSNFPLLKSPRQRPATAVAYSSRERKEDGAVGGLDDLDRYSYDRGRRRPVSAKSRLLYHASASERPKSAHAAMRRYPSLSDDGQGAQEEEDDRGAGGGRTPQARAWEQRDSGSGSGSEYDGERTARSSELLPLTPVPPAAPRSASSSATTRSGRGSGAGGRPRTAAAASAPSSAHSSDRSSSLSPGADADVATTAVTSAAGRAQPGTSDRQRQQRPKSAKRIDRAAEHQPEERSHSRVTLSEDGSYEEVPLDETDSEDEVPAAAAAVAIKKESEEKSVQTGWDLFNTYDPSQAVVLEGPKAQYTIRVRTGRVIGASGNVPIHIVLFGNRGCSLDIPLESSSTYKIPFQKGQEDVFNVETLYVGELQQIRIGHNRADTGQWFLESVAVEDLTKGWVYEFSCNKWLSSKSSDKMTRRDLAYSSTRLIELPDELSAPDADDSLVRSVAMATVSSPRGSNAVERGGAEQAAAAADSSGRSSPTGSMGYSQQSTDGSRDGGSNFAAFRHGSASSPAGRASGESHNEDAGGNTPGRLHKADPSGFGNLTAGALTERPKGRADGMAQEAEGGTRPKKMEIIGGGISNSFFDILLKGSTGGSHPGAADDGDSDSDSVGSDYMGFIEVNHRAAVQSSAELRGRNEGDDEGAASDAESQGQSTVIFENASLTSRELHDNEGYILGSKVNALSTAVEASNVVEGGNESSSANIKSGSIHLTTGPSIHGASRVGNLSRIKELIRYNQDLRNAPDDFGDTPLHVACQYGHADTVQWLLDSAKADDRIRNRAGYEAAHVAALHGHIGCVRSILSSGTAKDVNVCSDDDKTLLHLAASAGHLQSCRFLIANGASLNALDSFGRTAADIAGEYNHSKVKDYLEACLDDMSTIAPGASTGDQKITKALVHVGDLEIHNNGNSAPLLDDVKEKFPDGDDEMSVGSSAVDFRHKIEHQQELQDKKRLYEEMQEKKKSGMTFLDMVRQEAGDSSDVGDTY